MVFDRTAGYKNKEVTEKHKYMKHTVKAMIKTGSYLVLVIMMLASVSCSKELEIPVNGDETLPDGKVLVSLYTNAENISQPSSRATERAAADESSVSDTGRMPWVFVFSGTGNAASFVEVKQAILTGTPSMPRVLLSRKSGSVEVLVMANAPANFYNGTANVAFNETILTTLLTGKTLAQAKALLQTIDVSIGAIPYNGGYLPMVGTTSFSAIDGTTSIGTNASKLALKRIVAKVTVTSSAANFAVKNWSIAGAKKNSLFFDETVTAGNLVNFNETLSTAGTANPIYVYASNASESFVIVKATFNGTDQYYKLAFRSNTNTILPVERNKWYKFNITSVNMGGYSSFAAAFAAPAASNSTITATISVVDLDSYDIIDNGQYYLGATNTQALFYGFPYGTGLPYTATTVSTNATSAMVGGTNSVTLKDVNPAGTLTLAPASNTLTLATGTTPATTDIKIETINTGFISAKIEIRLGTLYQVIEVNRAGSGFDGSGGTMQLNFQGSNIYTTAENAPAWIYFSSDGINNLGTSYTQPNAAVLTPVYIFVHANLTPLNRTCVIFLSRATQGRVKAYIRQIGLI